MLVKQFFHSGALGQSPKGAAAIRILYPVRLSGIRKPSRHICPEKNALKVFQNRQCRKKHLTTLHEIVFGFKRQTFT